MKIILFMIISLNAFSSEIDATKVNVELKKLGDELKLEEAEKYIQDLISSGEEWCLYQYKNGNCARKVKKMPETVEATLNKMRACVPPARTCSSTDIDKVTAEICIDQMESQCWLSRTNDIGHPNVMTRIYQKARERLPLLKHSAITTPPNIAEAYNKCQDNQFWGYTGRKKPNDKRIVNYAVNSESIIFGQYLSESDCHEARLLAEKKTDIELTGNCIKRFIGEDVEVKIAQAKAMIKFSGADVFSDRLISFSSMNSCNENINKKRKYKFQKAEYEFEELEISQYKSKDTMRFIGDCKDFTTVVCGNNKPIFNKIEIFD